MMKLTTPMKAIPTLLAALLGAASQAGTLDPGLEEAIAGMSPGDPVNVIIRCTDPLDPASVPSDDLIPALQNKGAACERSLSNVLENTALEPPADPVDHQRHRGDRPGGLAQRSGAPGGCRCRLPERDRRAAA